jgi:hypothetical protein
MTDLHGGPTSQLLARIEADHTLLSHTIATNGSSMRAASELKAVAEAKVGRAVAQIGGKGKTGWAGRGNSWPRFSIFFIIILFYFPLKFVNFEFKYQFKYEHTKRNPTGMHYYIFLYNIYLLSYLGKYFQI